MDMYDRIEKKRREMGVSKRKMCAEAGVNYHSLATLYQRRTKNISMDNASKLADYLGVSIDYLLRGDETPPREQQEQLLHDLEDSLKGLGVIREDGTVDEAAYGRLIRFLKSNSEFVRLD